MFERYAIYYTATGAFASHGAAWLGWDVKQGHAVAHPSVNGLDLSALTKAPRKYGFHGTIKPPFRLANGTDAEGLHTVTKTLAQSLSKVTTSGLEVAPLGRFLALVPLANAFALRQTAAKVVQALDGFRAPMSDEEFARRRKGNLSPAQEQNLLDWGYPHVMDHFRFHITLTSKMPRTDLAKAQDAARRYFAPVLHGPFELDALTLVGQRKDGMFVSIERFPMG